MLELDIWVSVVSVLRGLCAAGNAGESGLCFFHGNQRQTPSEGSLCVDANVCF